MALKGSTEDSFHCPLRACQTSLQKAILLFLKWNKFLFPPPLHVFLLLHGGDLDSHVLMLYLFKSVAVSRRGKGQGECNAMVADIGPVYFQSHF